MIDDILLEFVRTELLGDSQAEVGAADDLLVDGTIDYVGVARLVDFVEKEFRVSVPTEDVVPEHFASVALLAAYVGKRRKGASELTNAQQMLWTSQQLNPGVPLNNTAFLFTINGPVDPDVFRAAFRKLVDEADVLRTVIASEDGVARQAVLNTIDYKMRMLDLSQSDDPDNAARAWAQESCQVPLDMATVTFDTALIKLGEARFAWYFNQHHILADGWALGVLYDRLESWYSAIRLSSPKGGVTLDPFPSFARYVEYERDIRDSSSSTATRPSDDESTPLSMYGASVGGDSAASTRISVAASPELSDALLALAQTPPVRALTPDLSMFQLLATAMIAFVHRTGGQNLVTIGVPVHNRSTAEFRRMPGLFMEVYPLEVEVEDADTFASLHERVASGMADVIRSAKPGHASAAANRHISAVLNYLTVSFKPFAGMPVHAEWVHTGSVDPHHAFRLQVHDFDASGTLTFGFDANTAVFPEHTRDAMPGHFFRILSAAVDEWEQPIGAVDLLSSSEKNVIDQAINPGGHNAVDELSVVAQFEQWAANDPESIAIIESGTSYTYGDLERLTRSIASAITPKSIVGVALDRSAEAVMAMLGVLRAGSAYVPIDPAWPTERIEFVSEDAGVDLIISDEPMTAKTPNVSPRVLMDHEPTELPTIEASDLAYVLYTSGSTGTPKGVMVEHRSLANYASWASRFYDGGQRLTFPLFTALTFDLTLTSVFVPLISGGSIRIYPGSAGHSDLSILAVLEDDAVDIVKLTPSHLALAAETTTRPRRIRQLILGGEDLTTAAARRAADQFESAVAIHNEYGPTEATVGCVIHTFDPDTDTESSVPIGTPIDGVRAYVVDMAGNPVPFGVPGELLIAGRGVARGYIGLSALTSERFGAGQAILEDRAYRTGDIARVRPNGVIEYLGRRDDQIKIKGIRAELGEIESALASHPEITASAARVWEEHPPDGRDDLIYCTKCGLASDYPGVSFDTSHVCSECRAFEEYEAKARVYFKREDELVTLLSSQRDTRGQYDCISLLSGGKDSSYVLCRLVDMGLNVLALTLDNGYLSDQAKGNIARVVDALGVDHRFMTTPAMDEIFVDSLQRHANVCHGCFKTIYTLGMQTALDEDIPYIVTGLSRGQFFETRLTADLFTELSVTSAAIDANVLEARKAYHQVDDAVRRLLDVSIFEDDRVFEEVQFVDFYRYVDVNLDELYAYLEDRVPWVKPTDTGRSTNCLINDVGIYYHRKTRGFHNYALPYSWDVRMGHKTREAALEELDDAIDVTEVARILDEIGFPDDVTGSDASRSLVSYYVAPVELPAPQLKEHMAGKLPRQLVPSRFVRLDALPLTANGKVDRERLPAADTHRPEMKTAFVAPQSDNEIALTRIWEQVLGVSGIGVRDNYFDLGGDSITAVQIVARANREGLSLTIPRLLETLTVAGAAALLETTSADTEHMHQESERMAAVEESELEKLVRILGESKDTA